MGAERIELRQNKVTRRWRWNFVSSNNKVVGSSQRYRSKDAALNGIKAARLAAVYGEIVEVG